MAKTKNTAYVALEGSKKAKPNAVDTKNLNPEQSMEVAVRIRRKDSIEPHLEQGRQYSHEAYEKMFGASDEDVDKIETFAHNHHLAVAQVEKGRRSVILKGTVSDFEKAFQVKLSCYKSDDGNTFRGRAGDIHIPEELKDVIDGVFGLDDRPHLRPMFKIAHKGGKGSIIAHRAGQSFNPNDLSTIYSFPKGVTGKGQCIGIIELDGGYRTKDLQKYFDAIGVNKPSIKAYSVDNGRNKPSTSDSADGEVMPGIEVAGAVAPDAGIVVYFSPNTDKGFSDAVTTALHDARNKPSVISISWGSAEKNWTKQSLRNFNEAFKAAALLGVTICCAAGDQGSSDAETDGKVHADFPASSPYVLACGGTSLKVRNNQVASETVWHDSNDSATGGGVSDFFPLPDYQKNTSIPVAISTQFKGRGLPDVAANADPNTGYNILVDGEKAVISGTSAVAPLMGGLIALINEKNKSNAGFINPKLYTSPHLCRDITEGDNITTKSKKGYKAGEGWGILSRL